MMQSECVVSDAAEHSRHCPDVFVTEDGEERENPSPAETHARPHYRNGEHVTLPLPEPLMTPEEAEAAVPSAEALAAAVAPLLPPPTPTQVESFKAANPIDQIPPDKLAKLKDQK
jgi:hypothetical protein